MSDTSEDGVTAADVAEWNRTLERTKDSAGRVIRRIVGSDTDGATPSAPVAGVGVKALEWDGDKAVTPFGTYYVNQTPDGYELRFEEEELVHVGYDSIGHYFESVKDEARKYAQPDFEQRIRSARTPAPSVGAVAEGQPVEVDLDAGVNRAIELLADMLAVDRGAIVWDAATEEFDGDVQAVLGSVMRAAYGDDWSSNPRETATIRAALATPTAPNADAIRASDVEAFDNADWYWLTLDPDDSGDSPSEALNRGMVGQYTICEVASSYTGLTRFGFIAPVLDPDSDDEEFLHFATKDEAMIAAGERLAAIRNLARSSS